MSYLMELLIRFFIFYVGFVVQRQFLMKSKFVTQYFEKHHDTFLLKMLAMFIVIVVGQLLVLLCTPLKLVIGSINVIELLSISLAVGILFHPHEEVPSQK